MNRVDVCYVSEDSGQVADFITALTANGLDVQTATAQPSDECPVVVLITQSMLDAEESARAQAVTGGYDEVLPVSFLPGPAPIFAGLSQSLIGQLGIDKCAARVSTIVKHGGRAIVGWNNLVSDAQRWQAEGKQALIAESDIGGSLALLQSEPAKVSDRRGLVRDYIAASQAAIGRRRRVGQVVIGTTAAVLTIVLVFAVVQAINARIAQNRADEAAGVATASRLAREAVSLISGDPDLPSLLAARALQSAQSPAAQTAAARVAASTWPHKSHQLGFQPAGISAAAASDRIAVVEAGQGVRVYESAGGTQLGEFPFEYRNGSGGELGLLNPSGDLLAVQTRDSNYIRVFDVDSGDQLPAIPRSGGIHLLDWLDGEHVLIGRRNQLVSMGVRDGTVTTITEAPGNEPIDSASFAPEQDRIVVATGTSVLIVNATTHDIDDRRAVTLTDPVLSDDGSTVMGLDYPRPVTYRIDDVSADPELQPVVAHRILPLGKDFALITTRDGELSVLSQGRIFQTVRAHLNGRVWAARLPDDRIATVGADGFLRDWAIPPIDTFGVPTSIGLVDESTRMSSAIGVEVAPRESARNQIRRPSAGLLAVTTLPGYAHVLTIDNLETTDRRFFDGLTADVSLSKSGTQIASVGPKRARSFAFDTSENFWTGDRTRELPGTKVPTAIGDGGKAVSAVSDDGSTILIADEYLVSLRRSGDNTDQQFDIGRTPVSLNPTPTGAGVVLTNDGYIRDANGSEEQLALPSADQPMTITAAEPRSDGGFTVATDDGQLFISGADRQLTALGTIGAGNESFALRTSSDEERIAVIGQQGIVVFDTTSGEVIFREAAPGATLVTDVVFSEDNTKLYAVNRIGAVRSIKIEDANSVQLVEPRDLTPQESALFNLGEG
ncbi:hypothetical protein L2K20_20685 [Mycobacterium sp. MBM]|nr:hypothetical protein [Mycobacterium sp. MBM]